MLQERIKRELEGALTEGVKDGSIALNYNNSSDRTAVENILTGLITSHGSLNCGVNILDDNVILNFDNINGLIEISRYDNPEEEDVISEAVYSTAKLFSSSRNFEETITKLKEDIVTIENSLVQLIAQASQVYSAEELEFLNITGITFKYPVSENKTPLLRVTAVTAHDEDGTVVIFKYATDVVTNMGFKNDGKRGSMIRLKR